MSIMTETPGFRKFHKEEKHVGEEWVKKRKESASLNGATALETNDART